jgi:hypothetical protein
MCFACLFFRMDATTLVERCTHNEHNTLEACVFPIRARKYLSAAELFCINDRVCVCLCLCVCVCVCVCARARVYTCVLHTYICTCIYALTYTCTHKDILTLLISCCVCTCVRACACMFVSCIIYALLVSKKLSRRLVLFHAG